MHDSRTLKYLIRGFLILLTYVILTLITSSHLPLEWHDEGLKFEYDLTLILATPLLVFILVILDYLNNKNQRSFFINFILGIPLSIISLLAVLFLYRSFDSSRGNEKVLFENRFKNGQTIISRTRYWESEPNKTSIHRVIKLGDCFQWTTKYDTANINLYRWVPINP
ncbi:hypothetical protein BFP97_15060 [Roseivirga sp. 4D4]|nr:hypothetical protein BFP97_15060 [Roseivirga sp. 4D4]